MKKLVSLVLVALAWGFAPLPVSASENFQLKFDVSYKVQEDAKTTVTYNFALTNLTTEKYAAEYSLLLGKTKVEGLRAFDRTGALPIELRLADDGSKDARIEFADHVVGEGKTLNWSVLYETPDIAQKVGRLWVVTIPKPGDIVPNSDYTVKLTVPPSFGKLIWQRPGASAIGNVWPKTALMGNKITAVYAPEGVEPYQAYDFSFKYRLTNNSLLPSKLPLALPPDTQFQKIFLSYLNPRPEDVIKDEDGNWLAYYTLGPTSHRDIVASGSALVAIKPLSGAELNQQNFSPIASKIHHDLAALRQLNPTKKEQKDFTCTDFAQAFITEAKKSQITAKQVDGLVVGQGVANSDDSLHCWVEYFDSQVGQWRMIDPAWQSRTKADYFKELDFTHLSLVIHGKDPLSPVPPGLYQGVFPSKDLVVTPVNKNLDINEVPVVHVRADIPSLGTSGLPLKLKVIVENMGPTYHAGETIVISSKNFTITPKTVNTGPLPPFATREVDFQVDTGSVFAKSDGIITLTIQNQSRDYPLKLEPIHISKPVLIVGGLTGLGFISLIAQITRSLLLQKRRR